MQMNESHLAQSYLTLGDGDFSYSLDLATFLSSYQQSSSKKSSTAYTNLTVTGIDTFNELQQKYQDVNSILQKLRKFSHFEQQGKLSTNKKAKIRQENDSKEEQGTVNNLSVSIHHSINAIVEPKNAQDISINKLAHHHVIFNHPHLGIEDSKMHQRFLSHFFHSAENVWLHSPGGVLHLTLAEGQCERWHALQSAKKHGLTLLHRCSFEPPPPPPLSKRSKSYYQHRRHQNGKSFASRTTYKSETLTFGRKVDEGNYVATCLPWLDSNFHLNSNGFPVTETIKKCLNVKNEIFSCPHCPKTFREKRSVKNHIRSVHSSNENNSNAGFCTEYLFICDICNPKTQSNSTTVTNKDKFCTIRPRVFPSAEALASHKIAKHTGTYTDTKPDWFTKSNNENPGDDLKNDHRDKHGSKIIGSCAICGFSFKTKEEQKNHAFQFIPMSSSKLDSYFIDTGNDIGSAALANECSFCHKRFREQRALHQHFNFCSKRVSISKEVRDKN